MFINLRKILLLSTVIVSTLLTSAQQTNRPFQYPTPPDNLETLGERTSYLVEHFWDRCNMKSIFSSKKNFEAAFDDYISFMPYADSAVVFNSIDRLIKEVKKNQANMATMSRIAREKMYSDTAPYPYDAIYLPFAKAATQSGGLTKEEKETFTLDASRLSNSQVGMTIPSFDLTLPDGTKTNIRDLKGAYLLVMVDEPDDFNNRMARTRLATDYALNELIEKGDVKVILLNIGRPDEDWRQRAATYPSNWIIASSQEADRLLDRRFKPAFFYTNKNQTILSKSLRAENLVEAFRTIYNQQNAIKAERERLRQEALKKKMEETGSAGQ